MSIGARAVIVIGILSVVLIALSLRAIGVFGGKPYSVPAPYEQIRELPGQFEWKYEVVRSKEELTLNLILTNSGKSPTAPVIVREFALGGQKPVEVLPFDLGIVIPGKPLERAFHFRPSPEKGKRLHLDLVLESNDLSTGATDEWVTVP